jgi:glycosyltransferase involved in cell wall biosynthesis
MRVGIDVKTLSLHKGGIGVFLRSVLPVLVSQDPGVRYVCFGPAEALEELPAEVGRVVVTLRDELKGRRIPFYDQVQLPRALVAAGVDLFFSPYFDAPAAYRCPVIVTMHDAVHLRFPEFYPASQRFYYRTLMVYHGVHSAAVVTDSAFSKSELVQLAGIEPSRIHVIPLALPPGFESTSSEEARSGIRKKHSLPADFVLYTGGAEARKNISTMLRAFGEWNGRSKSALPLVISGEAKRFARWGEELGSLGIGKVVFLPGRMSGAELPDLYAAARAVIYPSLYEGFGFPLLEAMASGVPVACSRRGSLPEIGQDAAVYFDPENLDDMIGALERVTGEESVRADLVRKGLVRAGEFSMGRTADSLGRLFKSVGETCL